MGHFHTLAYPAITRAMTSQVPIYQIYGRRKGKPLRRYHSTLMDSLLPQVAGDLESPLAGTGDRRWLEIGFGGGEHLAHQAALHPDVSLIGAEPFLNGVAKLLAEIDARKLANVKVHYGDARPLLDALPNESLERIYLLYPDPWPKERQKKRRFVSASNLLSMHRVLQKNGLFLFASDINDYVEWTRAHVIKFGFFDMIKDDALPFEGWHRTRYEAKAIRESREPRYLTYQKSGRLP
jgi:tRNA (guanine-N7-)-methyltransferase